MTEYYKEKLEAGLEYQDFVAEQLRKGDLCIILGAYSSRKYQLDHGESASGIEIKYDMKMAKTGNLYIETAEKSSPQIDEWTDSGIFRRDNTWLYLIGDYEQAFLFSKHQLQRLYHDIDKYQARGIRTTGTETSQGFLYPISSAMNGMCLRRFVWKKKA